MADNERDTSKWDVTDWTTYGEGEYSGFWTPWILNPYNRDKEPVKYERWIQGWLHGCNRASYFRAGWIEIRRELVTANLFSKKGE